mmetsp:Transcript_13265/g.42392  ORF Transcript_13265/g.42392 Transcript_13265/m.42392 type:complete len:257 (+) Transcript_13265:580-1350(+)
MARLLQELHSVFGFHALGRHPREGSPPARLRDRRRRAGCRGGIQLWRAAAAGAPRMPRRFAVCLDQGPAPGLRGGQVRHVRRRPRQAPRADRRDAAAEVRRGHGAAAQDVRAGAHGAGLQEAEEAAPARIRRDRAALPGGCQGGRVPHNEVHVCEPPPREDRRGGTGRDGHVGQAADPRQHARRPASPARGHVAEADGAASRAPRGDDSRVAGVVNGSWTCTSSLRSDWGTVGRGESPFGPTALREMQKVETGCGT